MKIQRIVLLLMIPAMGAVFFSKWNTSNPAPENAADHVQVTRAPGKVVNADVSDAEGRFIPLAEPVPTDYLNRLSSALATKDPFIWEPVLVELINPRLDRDKAIEMLIPLLEYPDWMVRVRVAQDLLELGSYAGVPTLQRALREGARGRDRITATAVETAAQTLHRFRQPLDADDLYVAYEKFGRQYLLELAALHEARQVYDLVSQTRARGESTYRTERLAAYLGLKDPESIRRYTDLTNRAGDYPAQLLGHWALHQATGDADHLGYVIGSAREHAGLDPRSERSQPWSGTDGMVFDFLKITITPASTRALEDIADFAGKQSGGNTNVFQRAFGALFYLHRDYAFVDERVESFLRGDYTGPSIDRSLLWKIAVVRNSPSLKDLEKPLNRAIYEKTFMMLQGRPLESWNDVSYVPVRVATPIKSEAK